MPPLQIAAACWIRAFFATAVCLLLFKTSLVAQEPNASEALGAKGTWADFVETNFPFFSSALDARGLGQNFPSDNLTPRGIILNPGKNCWACFDTDLLRMSAIWEGKGISPVSMAQISYLFAGTKAREGEEHLPEIIGQPWLANGIYPGWQTGERFSLVDPREPGPDKKEIGRGQLPPAGGRFKAIRLTRAGVSLEYEVAGSGIQEWLEASLENQRAVVQRQFRVDRAAQPLWLILGRTSSNQVVNVVLSLPSAKRTVELIEENGLFVAHIFPSQKPVEFSVRIGAGVKRETDFRYYTTK